MTTTPDSADPAKIRAEAWNDAIEAAAVTLEIEATVVLQNRRSLLDRILMPSLSAAIQEASGHVRALKFDDSAHG